MLLDVIFTASGALLLAATAARTVVAVVGYAKERVESDARSRREAGVFRRKAESVRAQLGPAQIVTPAAGQATRQFRVIGRTDETRDGTICSFYLRPTDNQPLPTYLPGQFLSFAIPNSRDGAVVHRCYSLSDAPGAKQAAYRVSIKKIQYPGTPPGVGSGYFHDHMFEGQMVDVLPPSGTFYLDQDSNRPVVLIAGGIGITPLLSMLNWVAAANSQREIWLVYGVRNRTDHAFQNHIAKLCQSHSNIRCITFYSRPTPTCRRGVDFDVEGHINVDVLKRLLKARNYAFYMCGPPAMMTSVQTDLVNWGVPAKDILTEQFGSPATDSRPQRATFPPLHSNGTDPVFQVEFLKSGMSVAWSAQNGSLLELAEACGINARCSCRAGQCGTCKVSLKSGQIAYRAEPALPPEAGTCLPCIAQPVSDLTLDM